MLDIKFLRANPEIVKQNIKNKDVYKRQVSGDVYLSESE